MTRPPVFSQQIEWRAGGAQGHHPRIECGEEFLVAVRVYDSQGHCREWWEFSIIAATETGFEVEGDAGWGWSWDEVEWYVPVGQLTPPIPEEK